jgi:hypothetical protein
MTRSQAGADVPTVLGVDAGSRTLKEADHLVRDIAELAGLGEDLLACTHLIRTGTPHIALSFHFPVDVAEATLGQRLADHFRNRAVGLAYGDIRSGPQELVDAAVEAAARTEGRAVLYPGHSALTGTISAAALLRDSAIERLTVLGAPDAPGTDDLIDTRDHVRPQWRDDTLTLTLTPAGAGRYAPFEVPHPTPCCADHG